MTNKTQGKKRQVDHKIPECEAIPESDPDFRDLLSRFLRTHGNSEIIINRGYCLRINQIQKQKPSGALQYPKPDIPIFHRITVL